MLGADGLTGDVVKGGLFYGTAVDGPWSKGLMLFGYCCMFNCFLLFFTCFGRMYNYKISGVTLGLDNYSVDY